METVKELMKEAGWGTLATTDGEKVGCRPMSGLTWMGDELWCATFANTDKAAQLQKVPHAEYCFGNQDGKHVRIAGPCTISTDNGEKLRLYEALPELQHHIADPASQEYVVIKMKPDRIRLMVPPDFTYKDVELA